jgi:hypothetical protein
MTDARRSSTLAALFAAALALVAPARTAAQSVLAAGGLGVPVDPVDARGRAMGAVGPGLFGTGVIPGEPTAALELSVPTIVFSMQSSWLSIDQGGQSTTQRASRFPAFGASYPVRAWGVATLTFGGFLDQRWSFQRDRTLDLGAGSVSAVTDHFVSDGGIAALRLGFARRVTRHIGLGGSVGTYTGNVLRQFTRTYDSLGVNVPITPFVTGGRWGYSGALVDGAVSFDVADVLRGGFTAEWSAHLKAEPDSATGGASKTYAVPVQLRGGLSARLAPGLAVSASGSYADWTKAGEDLASASSTGGALAYGAGLELERTTLFGRGIPIRLGWHHADLPFRIDAGDPVESAIGGGFGVLLARQGNIPLGRLDFAVERGKRTSTGIDESYWRSTVTFRAAGF